jgi:hypothetical protein
MVAGRALVAGRANERNFRAVFKSESVELKITFRSLRYIPQIETGEASPRSPQTCLSQQIGRKQRRVSISQV